MYICSNIKICVSSLSFCGRVRIKVPSISQKPVTSSAVRFDLFFKSFFISLENFFFDFLCLVSLFLRHWHSAKNHQKHYLIKSSIDYESFTVSVLDSFNFIVHMLWFLSFTSRQNLELKWPYLRVIVLLNRAYAQQRWTTTLLRNDS